MKMFNFSALRTGVLLILMAFSVTGCTAIQSFFQDNKKPLEYGIKLAVIDLVEQGQLNPKDIVDVTNDIGRWLSSNPTAQASDIISYVSKEIPWEKLTMTQTMIVQSILASTEEKIKRDIERGILDRDARTSVYEVLTWINEAASLFLR